MPKTFEVTLRFFSISSSSAVFMMASSEASPEWPAFPTRLMALPSVSDAYDFALHMYSRSKVSLTPVFVCTCRCRELMLDGSVPPAYNICISEIRNVIVVQ